MQSKIFNKRYIYIYISLVLILGILCSIFANNLPVVNADDGDYPNKITATIWSANTGYTTDPWTGGNRWKFNVSITSSALSGQTVTGFCQNPGWFANARAITLTSNSLETKTVGNYKYYSYLFIMPSTTDETDILSTEDWHDKIPKIQTLLLRWLSSFNEYWDSWELALAQGNITETQLTEDSTNYANNQLAWFINSREGYSDLGITSYSYDGLIAALKHGSATTINNSGIYKYRPIITFNRQNVRVTFVEELTGEITLTKTSQNSSAISKYPLTGAQFTAYTDSACTQIAKDTNGNNAIWTATADGSCGTLTMTKGTYYIKETKAPTNGYYAIDTSVKTVMLNAGDKKSVTFTDSLKPGQGKVQKNY